MYSETMCRRVSGGVGVGSKAEAGPAERTVSFYNERNKKRHPGEGRRGGFMLRSLFR